MDAGTYIIIIAGSSQYTSSFEYSLDLIATKRTTGYATYQIGELLYNKGLQGVCWENDYLPFGEEPNVFDSSTYIFGTDNNVLNIPNYALKELTSILDGNSFLLREFFVWGSEAKAALAEIFAAIIQAFFDNYNPNVTRRLEYTKDIANNVIQISCLVGGIVVSNVVVSGAIGVIGFISSLITNHFFDMLIPSFGIDDLYFTEVLGEYIGVLSSTSDSSIVVRFPIFCTLEYNYHIIPSFATYSFTTVGTFEKIYTENLCTYSNTSDYIYSSNQQSFLKGKIYGISVDSELNVSDVAINSISDINPMVSNFGTLGSFKTSFNGGYYWLSFCSSFTGNQFFEFKYNNEFNYNFFVELFNNVVPGYSTLGRVSYYPVNATEISTGSKVVIFSLQLYQDQQIYFRITGESLCKLDISYSLPSNSVFNYLNHVHVYNHSYSWKSLTQHYAFCSCGLSTIQGHAISANSLLNAVPDAGGYVTTTCLLCGGLARIGFLPGLYNLNFNHSNDIILIDGITIINDI